VLSAHEFVFLASYQEKSMFFALNRSVEALCARHRVESGLLASAHVRSATHCYSSRQSCEHAEVILSPG
jgi:hypothetical protein